MGMKKDQINTDEHLVISQFIMHIRTAAEWLDNDDETWVTSSVEELGFEAHLKLLNDLYYEIGEEKLQKLKQFLEMAMDADFRCPK